MIRHELIRYFSHEVRTPLNIAAPTLTMLIDDLKNNENFNRKNMLKALFGIYSLFYLYSSFI